MTAPPPASVQRTWYDRLSGRIAADPALARRMGWVAPILVTLLAGILRMWNLGHPHSLMFDETYYLKDAWAQWNLGYPASWPEGSDEKFAAGDTDGFTTEGSFVVHPPLGKILIGAGMALFGADSSVGWRFSAALFGTASVLVLYLAARTLTRSIAFATIAAGLMAIDGLAIVMSRVSLLDIFLTFFVLLGFWFILLDRQWHAHRLRTQLPYRERPYLTAPLSWNRPWLIAAGAAFGAATAVKWSGLYVLVGFGLYVVVTDAVLKHRLRVKPWPAEAFLQGAVSFVLYVPIALVTYLVSWTGWLTSSGGYGRDNPGTALPEFVPEALRALWQYHSDIYNFHIGVTSAHNYASPAWEWPLLLRPTAVFFESSDGCNDAAGCVQNVYTMPNPLIWYAAVVATLYLVYRMAYSRNWRHAVVLVAVATTYVPWLLYPERTIFQFYTVAILPFLLLALTFALREIASANRKDPRRRRGGQWVVIIVLIAFVLASAWWYPILIAETVPNGFWRMHAWLSGWI